MKIIEALKDEMKNIPIKKILKRPAKIRGKE